MKPRSHNPDARCLTDDRRAPNARECFPQTDYNFRTSAEARATPGAPPEPTHIFSELRTFRGISAGFMGREINRESLTELACFALITAISAWPVASMISAMARLIR